MLGNQISLTNNVAKQVVSVTATQNQTDFTVQGGYRINQLGVYRNGVRQVDGRDYIARNGATVTLLSQGANAGDAMEFVVFDDFRVADALSVNTGGTVNASVNITGALQMGTGTSIFSPADNVLTFGTNSAERVRVASDGKVGIGTDDPGQLLTVGAIAGGADGNLSVKTNSNTHAIAIEENNGNENYQLGVNSSGDLGFYNSGSTTPTVTFSDNDRVGIGTTIPGAFLDAQVSNANTVLQLKRTDAPAKITSNFGGGDSALKYTVNDASSFLVGIDDSNSDAFKLSFGSSDDAAFGTNDFISVSTSGNIGINDTSPGHLLSVKDGDIASMKNASASGGNAVNMMRFRVENSSDTSQKATLGGISAETVSSWGGSLTFHTKTANGTPNDTVTERMRIDNGGDVGINTANPTSRLHVNIGADQTWVQIHKSRAANEPMLQLIHSAGNRDAKIRFANADSSWSVGIDGSEHLVIKSGETDTGGSGSTRARFTTNGLCFGGDTDAANALNDYEEGTHVPAITLGSGSISTNTDDTLSYVKVGRLVHVQGRIHLTLSDTDVTSFSFTLPFANCTALAEQSEDTSAVTHVIRATTAGGNVDGIRHFRFTANTASVEMQTPDGGATGNFGVTNPHINVNFQYRST